MTRILEPATLALAIRERRKALGYTQARLASLCGTGVRFISDLENAKSTVELGKVLAVVATLGLDLYLAERGAEA
ncbi:MAG: helix-turn-helix transcriptional regulator [Spirochaetia bacterium]|nr:helix-turn-helix transcriptional regulator [Spirochaetia bacterium]